MISASDSPIFGQAPSGAVCHTRPAAYVVVRNADGRVAAVRTEVGGKACYWLPGGGMQPGETPEEAAAREAREELGCDLRLIGNLGRAVQFFYAGDEQRWYEMTATFFRAEFDERTTGAGEYELHWLDAQQDAGRFFHACHAWAASRAGDCTKPTAGSSSGTASR